MSVTRATLKGIGLVQGTLGGLAFRAAGIDGAIFWGTVMTVLSISTLGGLMMFGVMGFIVGPILAALFVTVWDMFATAFRSSI